MGWLEAIGTRVLADSAATVANALVGVAIPDSAAPGGEIAHREGDRWWLTDALRRLAFKANRPGGRIVLAALRAVAIVGPNPVGADLFTSRAAAPLVSGQNEGGCGAGVNLENTGGSDPNNPIVGSGGGYGGIYCFAMVP